MTVTVLQRKASMQQIGLLLVPAIKGSVYINTHSNCSQPDLTKLYNENIGGHRYTFTEDLCQFALKSVYSFSKYSVHKLVTDKRTNKWTDEQTKLQVENIMCPASLDWHTDKYSRSSRYCVCENISR